MINMLKSRNDHVQRRINGKWNLEEEKTGISSAFQDTIKIYSNSEYVDLTVSVFAKN